MTGVLGFLSCAAEILRAADVAWALVGGLAVSAHVDPRFTRDVDLVLAVPDEAIAEGVVLTFVRRGWSTVAVLEHAPTGRLSTVRLQPALAPEGAMVLDLLFASCGIEAEITREAVRLEIVPGVEMPVARIGHLMAMKLLAMDDRHRPQDRADLRALLRVADPHERRLAEQAIDTITRRGFHRGRDLAALLREVVDGA